MGSLTLVVTVSLVFPTIDYNYQRAPGIESGSILSAEPPSDTFMSKCLDHNVDALPLGLGDGKKPMINPFNVSVMYPSHWEAQSGRWNPSIVTENRVSFGGDCRVWMMGAVRNNNVFQKLIQRNPACQFHIFEPIPYFFNEIHTIFGDNVIAHPYGLASQTGTFKVSPDMDRNPEVLRYWYAEWELKLIQRNGGLTGTLEPFSRAIQDAGEPTTLVLDCEGCELTVLPEALRAGLLQSIPIIQFVLHQFPTYSYGKPCDRLWFLCELRYRLQQSHTMTGGVAFGWERWELLR